MNKYFEKYHIKKQKNDVGRASIKSKYTYYPFYDMETNSPINRYRMWVRYRDNCIKNGFKYVTFKQYGKILHKMGQNILKNLLNDPDGVVFKAFKVKIQYFKNRDLKNLDLVYKPISKKRNILNMKDWIVLQSENVKKELKKLTINGKINDYTFSRRGHNYFNKHLNKLDFFDDF